MGTQRRGQTWILLGLVAVLLSSVAYGADNSLVLYLAFDDITGGQTRDLSQYANHGVLRGNPAATQGKFDGALLFDAVDDQVVVPTNATLDIQNQITMMVWAQPGQNLTADYRTLVGKSPTSVLGQNTFAYDIRTDNTGIIRFSLNLGGTWRSILGPTFTPDTWYHVAGTYNGTQMVLYINGESVGTLPITGTIRVTTDPVCVGNLVSAAGAVQNEYWSGVLDEVRLWNRPLSQAEVKTNMQQGQREMLGAGKAYAPSPANLATDVLRGTALTWGAGKFAQTHDVYLGTAFADVNDAGRTSPKGVLVSQGQTETAYAPALPLTYGQTYYWRVDEVNAPPAGTIFKGGVWSFTVEPYAYPLPGTAITATASSAQPGMDPQRTVDGSGLAGDGHGVAATDMWLSGQGTGPAWIQYAFDRVYKIEKMQVWNSNQALEPLLGLGAKAVTIESSEDGSTWKTLGDFEFARAPGAANYAAYTTVDLAGAVAQYVKLTIQNNWGGIMPQYGLSEVRFFSVPVTAREPSPASAATGVDVDSSLNWRAGREAAQHKLYVSTDQQAVIDGAVPATTVTTTGSAPALDLGATYYWRVDEVNAAETPATWPGEIWSFSTQPYLVIDDFESYTDKDGEAIWQTWADGLENPANGGSLVGNDPPPYAESTIVHGGKQSMPLFYDNTSATHSEATRTFDEPQDWTAHGIKSLSLWFYGAAGNTGQLYVKINGVKIPYNGEAADLARPTWQVWNIDLSQAGNVKSLRTLTIGIEGTGAKGVLYFDDIRLYPKTPEYYTPVQPADTDLLVWWSLDEGKGTVAVDHSGNGHDGAFTGDPQWVTGHNGSALHFDGVDDSAVYNFPAPESKSAFTLVLWVKADQVGQVNYASPLAGYYPNTAGFQLDVDGGTPGRYRINPPGLFFGGVSTEWVCLSLAANGTAATLYYNGVAAATGTLNDTQWDEFCLGANRNRNVFWAGIVDDLRVYNRTLTAAEVAGLAGLTKPLAKPF